jgi:predicted DNA-binding transcriptional regulator YafY
MDRLMAILIALQQRPETAQTLADKMEVSKRTILRDMQSLSEMGIPLYSIPGPNGGFRLMDGFQLPPLHLDSREVLTVLFALRSLTKMSDTPFQQARWTAMDKIRAVLPEQVMQQVEPMLSRVEFEVPERRAKTPLLAELMEHTAASRWLHVLYRSERQRRWLNLKPVRIYTAHGFWYCEAYSVEHREARTFRADRFEAVEVVEKPEEKVTQAQRLGKNDSEPSIPPARIFAKLTYKGALLAEQDAHIGEQVRQIKDEEWELDFMCPASEWAWAVRFFYYLGMQAEVLEPESLRQEVYEMAYQLCIRYGSRR